MADLQCVICDFTVPAGSADDEVLALLGSTSPAAGALLVEHMSQHDLADWVRAFKMADAYIAQLEAQVADLEAQKAAVVRSPVIQAVPPFQQPMADLTGPEMARMSRQQQIRASIESADPNQTLIPHIPESQRPEGVVGVKY